jgi:hypothetical protein
MHMRRIAVLTATAFALMATPAFAQGQSEEKSPAQTCSAMSKKKTNHGKGQSPFAACVSGARRQNSDEDANRRPNPARACSSRSREKDSDDQMTPYAACVKGYNAQRRNVRASARS